MCLLAIAWRTHPEHIAAQKQGRLKYYEMYDIKVYNVMREDRTGRIVLMDFGSGAMRTDDLNDMPDLVGTPLYLAPELLTGSPATIARGCRSPSSRI